MSALYQIRYNEKSNSTKNKIKLEQSLCKPGQASAFQEVEDRRVQDTGHIKMVRL